MCLKEPWWFPSFVKSVTYASCSSALNLDSSCCFRLRSDFFLRLSGQLIHWQKQKKVFWLKALVLLFPYLNHPLVKFSRFQNQCTAFGFASFLCIVLSIKIIVPLVLVFLSYYLVILALHRKVSRVSRRTLRSIASSLVLYYCSSLPPFHVVIDSFVEPNNFQHKAPPARSGPDPAHKQKPTVST